MVSFFRSVSKPEIVDKLLKKQENCRRILNASDILCRPAYGRAGREELERQWPGTIPSIQQECGMADGVDWQGYLHALHKDGSPTAYVFRCLHCGKHLGYSDCN
jgi:uncharacterized protein CbrC (UPF0167 family)